MTNASDITLDNLTVKPASEPQRHEVTLRTGAHWGASAGVGLDDWMRLTSIFDAGEYARDGKLTTWLVLASDQSARLPNLIEQDTGSERRS